LEKKKIQKKRSKNFYAYEGNHFSLRKRGEVLSEKKKDHRAKKADEIRLRGRSSIAAGVLIRKRKKRETLRRMHRLGG